MAIRRIVKEGDPILRMKCRPVTEFGEKLNQLLDDMHETLEQANGVGLAAPQVGYCRRFFIMHLGDIKSILKSFYKTVHAYVTRKVIERHLDEALSAPLVPAAPSTLFHRKFIA